MEFSIVPTLTTTLKGYRTQKLEDIGNQKVAVHVHNVEKRYGKGPQVLDGLTMTVPYGQIYGLLGSSGCGKSTLISCILGLQKVDKGLISLYGLSPDTAQSRSVGIPGRNVGYMPQELSLHLELSISEIMRYFGILCGMTLEVVNRSREELTRLLQLPQGSTRLGTLSGGQLRRVSLACALQHNPKLIVLDEPTVGVDPILRHRIWEHLHNHVRSSKATVIVTTHYLDEAQRAHKIGVMRDGVLLIESAPQQLLTICNASSLDEAVLALCKDRNICHMEVNGQESNPAMARLYPEKKFKSGLKRSLSRLAALTQVNFALFSRNLLYTAFLTLIPTIFLSIVCLTFGHEPKDLKLGFVDYEMENNYWSPSTCPTFNFDGVGPEPCDFTMMTCRYLRTLQSFSVNLFQFDSEIQGISAVENGSLHGYLIIPKNFSQSLQDRFIFGASDDEEVFNNSRIKVRLDESNKIISLSLQVKLIQGFFTFARNLLSSCGLDPEIAQSPLNFKKPLVGREGLDLSDYNAIGFSFAAIFFFPIISGGIRLVREKNSGMLERSLVSGLHMREFITSYLVYQGFIIVIQIILAYSTVLFIFKVYNEGSAILVFVLLLLSGWSGLSFGLLLGSFCREEIEIAIIAIALLFPNVILAGIVWPVEGMPLVLQKISYFLPCTLASESIRSIFFRGWDLTHENVWPGFCILICYSVGTNMCTVLYHKVIKK